MSVHVWMGEGVWRGEGVSIYNVSVGGPCEGVNDVSVRGARPKNIELHGVDQSELCMLKTRSPRVDIYLSYPLQLTPS